MVKKSAEWGVVDSSEAVLVVGEASGCPATVDDGGEQDVVVLLERK